MTLLNVNDKSAQIIIFRKGEDGAKTKEINNLGFVAFNSMINNMSNYWKLQITVYISLSYLPAWFNHLFILQIPNKVIVSSFES